MDKWLAIFPKNLLAFLLIAGGTAFIIFNSPPHSICDSQIEVVNKNQQRFLFHDPKSKQIKTTKYERLRDHCKGTNDPGGCYELFQELQMMVRDVGSLSQECGAVLSRKSEYRQALMESAELLVRLAWGSQPPATYTSKLGWLEIADVTLFCRIKDRINSFYGESSWTQLRERLMLELPGAKDLPRNQIWDYSIFSENCARYP